MTLCDVNVWVALAIGPHVHHRAARTWFDSVTEPDSVSFCRATQHSLIRLLTTSALFTPYGLPALSNEAAWAEYDALVTDDRVAMRADEPAGLEHHWRRFATGSSASPRLWMDAYLAAFAVSAGARLVTTDAGFRRFRGLRPVVLA